MRLRQEQQADRRRAYGKTKRRNEVIRSQQLGRTEGAAEGAMGMGMMGGVPGFGFGGPGGRRGPGPAAPPPVKYEPSAWGRYVKVLLSSSEFMFIN